MLAVIKRELKSYFCSPIGYIVIGISLVIYSVFFYITAVKTGSIDLTNLFYCVAMYGLMFMVPLLTMWSFAGERKTGTEQLILTSPVSMLGVTLGKFISAFILVLIPAICSVMYFGILSYFSMPNIPIYLTSMLGFILLSMAYISWGILTSSITESPIVSLILTFIGIFLTTWIPQYVTALSDFSLINLFIKFLMGTIDIAATVTFITLTILCILITMIVMQRRKSVK
ncbi:ABC transporter permease [Romboutsia sp.]|uniref:ABC transporter permease n=1 Tax=Romboutsia sp. TaxID=1965302 RepID=UPI0021748668|nr:hypothetical protein [Romboutsia sp.]MCI9062849.1 hypothetical protein [Romboutsia sp.]